MTAKNLAELVNGSLVGDPDVLISSPAKIEEAREGQITFFANPKYEEHVYSTKASVVLVPDDFQPKKPIDSTLIKVANVRQTLALLLDQYGNGMELQAGISSQASVSNQAKINESVSIGAFTVVESGVSIGHGSQIHSQVYIGKGVEIGKNAIIYPGVRIYSNTVIGENCIIHANAVIGADGFGFNKDENGAYLKIQQTGSVKIGNNVEIGANTVIDRATMGYTIIGDGAKLDNLIQIAHNVEVGENTVIAAQAGIAGSTKLGKDCLIGGQAGLAGHISLADGTMVQAGTGVPKSTKEVNAKLYGYPAMNYFDYLRSYAVFKNLPELVQRLQQLEKELESKKS